MSSAICTGNERYWRNAAVSHQRLAQLLGLEQGRLQKGAPADIIRFDPDEPFVVDGAKLLSRCKNTPFDEARMQGVVILMVVGCEIVYESGI